MMKGGAQSQQEIVSDTHRLEHDKRRGKKGECREGGEEALIVVGIFRRQIHPLLIEKGVCR